MVGIMLLNIWIRVFLTSLQMYSSLQTAKAEELRGDIKLYDNGTVKDSPESPYCDKNQKIILSSYNFKIKKNCKDRIKCQYQKKPLSPEAAMVLHDGCSFKQECDSLDFSTQAEQHNDGKLDSVIIGYRCLDDKDMLYEMCGDHDEKVAGTVHLISGNATRQYSSCQCLLKGETNSLVAVNLNDVRLYSVERSERKCSNSVLKIDGNAYICNETSSAFGSVFNEELPKKLQNETITVNLDVKEPIFDMAWIVVDSQGSISMKCQGKQRENMSTGITSITKLSSPLNTTVKSDASFSDGITAQMRTRLIVLFSSVLTMAMLLVGIIVNCRRRRRMSKLPLETKAGGAEESSSLKHNDRPETTYFKIESGELGKQQLKDNVDIAEDEKSPSIRRQMACCLWLWYQLKTINSRKSPQLERAVNSESVLIAKDGPTHALVDINSIGSSSDNPVTNESQYQDENLETGWYGKEIDGVPMQETRQDERDDHEEKHHTYALLKKSPSNDSGLAISASDVYNNTEFKKPAPRSDPTYDHLPAERRSATSNYACNNF